MLRVASIIALLVTAGLFAGKSLAVTVVLICAAIAVSSTAKAGDAESFVAGMGLITAGGLVVLLLA